MLVLATALEHRGGPESSRASGSPRGMPTSGSFHWHLHEYADSFVCASAISISVKTITFFYNATHSLIVY